jgi:FkbM family methyltransferase
MLIPLDYIVQKYGVRFTGILHVGAHECEELLAYNKYLDRNNMLWVEALQDKVDFCKKKYPGLKIEQAVISDCVETVTFHRSTNGVLNNTESSSILEFGTHSIHHPHVKYIDEFKVDTKPLSDILTNYNIPFNFVNLDIQGVELKALKGMESYLHSIQYIYTEVNSDYVYKNCGLVSEIDEYLEKFRFRRVETAWCGNTGWGDAFYIKT